MRREDLADLNAFLTVAEERSFTRAAAKLGTSQSALSHTIRRLETRLDLRLLTRTTRSVAPTDAGERLLRTLRPAFDEIDAELDALTALRSKPAGTIRITTMEHPARTLLWPVLERMLVEHPDIHVELSIDNGLTDIVTERFDAGVRLSERVAKDMIAVKIGPDLRMAAVAAPGYFDRRGRPQHPNDLAAHSCINLRMRTQGGLYAWEFDRDGRDYRVRVEGQMICDNVPLIVDAALAGIGIAFLPDQYLGDHLETGRLERVLDDWCTPFPGYHLYYPSRRQPTPAFQMLVDRLRYRG